MGVSFSRGFAFAALSAVTACGGGGGGQTTTPTTPASPTPSPPPAGAFAVVGSSPAFGATVTGPDSDLQGVSELSVTFQMSYAESISDMYFVLELLSGSTECLRSQIGYADRLDGGPPRSYAANTTAEYRCRFFVRDNQQPGCGQSFTTDRIRFILQDRTQLEPGTNELRNLLSQDASGGWTFVFAR